MGVRKKARVENTYKSLSKISTWIERRIFTNSLAALTSLAQTTKLFEKRKKKKKIPWNFTTQLISSKKVTIIQMMKKTSRKVADQKIQNFIKKQERCNCFSTN